MRALRADILTGGRRRRLHGLRKCILLPEIQAVRDIQIMQIGYDP
jgi:hypothetical protein